ncbi:MAG: hypothetical protein COA82_07285 [Alkaliphilus sp.]|nr:MAG: hypothetical protein COA82_07285 [Alkaliphilus sp.]
MILHILEKSLNVKRNRSYILLFQFVITLILVITVLNIYISVEKSVDHLENVTKGLYKVNDNFVGDSERQFFSQTDNVNILKKLYSWQLSRDEFTYIVVGSQYFHAENNYFPNKFDIFYGSRHDPVGSYESLQVNNAFIEHFKLTVDEGRLFKEEDYHIDNEFLPIIMGYEYIPYSDIGDKITVYYLGKSFESKIIGFLSENSFYNDTYNIKSLNKYILMPALKTTNVDSNTNTIIDWEQKKFELKLYLDKCSGFLYSEFPSTYLQNMFTEKSYELDIVPYALEMHAAFYPTMWGLEGKHFEKLLFILTIIIFASSIFCISLNMAAKIKVLKRYYSIYIMNGTSSKVIYLSILLEILIINFLALLIASMIGWILYGKLPLMPLSLIYVITCVVSGIYPFFMMNKINISRILRGDD